MKLLRHRASKRKVDFATWYDADHIRIQMLPAKAAYTQRAEMYEASTDGKHWVPVAEVFPKPQTFTDQRPHYVHTRKAL